MAQTRGWTLGGRHGPVVLVTHVGDAVGSRAVAAALACAASEPARTALLIDLDGGRASRPSFIATAGARDLEERVAAHMPEAAVASRGQICHLTLPADPAGLEQVPAALPLARESAAVILLPPSLLQPLLEDTRVHPTAALLRADLGGDRALTALAVRDLIARDLRVKVLKRPLGWLVARAAPLGVLLADRALLFHLCGHLFESEDSEFRHCYDKEDETTGERRENPQQKGQGPGRARRWKEEQRTPKGQGHQ